MEQSFVIYFISFSFSQVVPQCRYLQAIVYSQQPISNWPAAAQLTRSNLKKTNTCSKTNNAVYFWLKQPLVCLLQQCFMSKADIGF